MNRDYADGKNSDVVFFVGDEVEKTPAFGLKTLFVVGVHASDIVMKHFIEHNCKHIFFGANHSFNPGLNLPDDEHQWQEWEEMIKPFLKENRWCSLDIPFSHVSEFLDSTLNEYNCFIPQIRVPIPYIKIWNYNTMIKIDDRDFRSTNPGVWCHSLHNLTNRDNFTDWCQYGLDTIIE
jgi:hypothetical protein